MPEYDHVVIGAGIVGSWTALQIVKLGKKVLLLEQFSELHTRGSSHGQSRIIRSVYEEEFFAEMMPFAFKMWRQLEEESGEKLIENCGLLCIYKTPAEDHAYQSCLSNMQTFSPEGLDLQETREDLFSRTLHFKEKPHALLFDKTGGSLFAHRALLAIQKLFKKEGGHLWSSCQVTDIVPRDDEVEVITARGQIIVQSVVVCAGAWTQKLLVPNLISFLPLKPIAVKVYYFKEKEVGAHSPTSGFPAIIDNVSPKMYALPSIEYPGLVKVCVHGGDERDQRCDPDKRDQTPVNLESEQELKKYMAEHMPLLEPEPAIVENCMYTLTPDEIFLIDRVPGHKNIVFGSGFSGTGFKTSPVVGRLLCEMATGKQPFLDISYYSLDRFAKG